MDAYDALDQLVAIDLSTSPTKADDLERAGRALAPDEHGFATFLVAAADHRLMAGELDRARDLLTEAGPGLPGELSVDIRARWLDWEMRSGDQGAVDARLDELRRAWRDDDLTSTSCHRVGVILLHAGDSKRALRWFTFPLAFTDLDVMIDPDADEDEIDPGIESCLLSRHSLRRELGLGLDGVDRVAAALQAELDRYDGADGS